ncbi:WecB/TagA/CpsF family glycosyltransferase [Chroococcidiopsis sp. CCMEE 29]|jgi:exopolysaccharide biosynthesis WecB/TagA/CpsF family protein|uniref:WecB/TagA/CpsF family glycosyltransferase n=1 Tax=Chroococcidiopsis sp. CCMEE 29 TaxID=155894 RepID=UPI00201FE75A|nr:WecB/TagA/CpsF family glycosyltransferase [Chroococcidiopsis sp. CCMEE 29]
MKRVNILNVYIDNLLQTELLEQLKSGVVFTPNVDHLIKLQNDREFLKAYSIADYKLCDSQMLVYASKFLGTPIKQKNSGSDFFPAFYSYHKNNDDIKIFLLGADKGIASKAQDKINSKVGRNIVVGAHSPSFGFEKSEKECLEIVEMIKQSDATVLAIGVGAPKQEKWIHKYKDKLPNIKIFLAIGATIDFEAENIKRSPKLMSKVGLEWLFRLFSEPKRLWKRYLIDDLPFFWLILQQKLSLYNISISDTQNYELGNNLSKQEVFKAPGDAI